MHRPIPAAFAAAAFLLAAGCTPAPRIAPAPADLDRLYDRAVYEAAVYRPAHVLPLKPAVADASGRVRVVTFTSWGGYHPDSTLTLTRDVWVTVAPEVQDSCRTFTGDVALRINQLLGLPPAAGYDHFAEMWVRAVDLFRPAADPSVTSTRPCPEGTDTLCGTAFPPGVSPEHVRWIASTMLDHWEVPDGYPWTRLGYTYNWHPGSPRYGASEYVVRSGATVQVASVTSLAEYCAAPSDGAV
ncbi:MAG TPA: hypothetical protein VFX98_17785 [Longimicrobiaceae bacterium]|nr:hypothetical protein [Longimicrobiaceae bacterium]